MPLQEFWNDDPDLLWVYRNSYINKIEETAKIKNEEAWLQGYYTYIAICTAFNKNETYPLQPKELQKKPLSKIEKNKEVENKIKTQLMNAQALLNQRRENKG